MKRYKMAVRWDNNRHEGFIGQGPNEAYAMEDALKQVMKAASDSGRGFTIIKPAEVHELPWSSKETVEKDWVAEEKKLDGDYGWP